MPDQTTEEQHDIQAASAAAAAFQAADLRAPCSSYFPGPSSGNMSSQNIPNIALHDNAGLFFQNAVPTTMDQVSFVTGIRSILEYGGNDITAVMFLEQMQEDFPPSRLLHPSVLRDGNYHKKLRTLMETLGVEIVEHPPGMKRLVARRMAYTIYAGEEYEQEREIADFLLVSYRTYNPITGIHAASVPQSPLGHSDVRQNSLVHNVPATTSRTNKPYKDMVYAFKERSSKYGGELDQNWADSIQQYDTTADIAELTAEEKLRCLPLMLRDDALTYFTVNVKSAAEDYEHACKLLSQRFHGRSRQMRIKAKLLSLTIQQFHGDGQALDITLTKLSSYIQKNFALVPSTFQCEDNKIDILMKAVRLQPWAETAIHALESNVTSYEGFLSKLSYGLQTYIDTQKLRGNHTPSLSDDSFPVNFQHSHGRYGNPNNPSRRPFTRHDSDQVCWNCGNSNCRVSRCSQPLNPKRIAANKLNWMSRGSRRKPSADHYKRVLLEFADELSELLHPDLVETSECHLTASHDIDAFFSTDESLEETDQRDQEPEQEPSQASINHFDILSRAASDHHNDLSVDADEGL